MIHKGFITSPELSGLQAIKAHYLLVNGNLHGFEAFCDDVISFSGLGDFIRLPVKTYSQGMAACLLFAVLTGGSHDCLAMDEGSFVLATLVFYEKAQERMTRFLSSAGTLLLASHSDELLRRFCCRGLVFDSGRIVFSGPLRMHWSTTTAITLQGPGQPGFMTQVSSSLSANIPCFCGLHGQGCLAHA